MRIWLHTLLALCVAAPAFAQSSVDKDAEIARLKKMIDVMRAAQPVPAASTRAPAPTAGGFNPGWIVSVIPLAPNGRQEDEIGKFVAKPEGFSYGDFRRTVGHPGWAKLKGVALFNAAEAGRYVFVVRVSWDGSPFSYGMTCRTQLAVNEAEIVGGESATLKQVPSQRPSDRTFQAGVDLEKGAVPIAFEASCYIDNGMDNTDRVFNAEPQVKPWFDNIRYRFSVRGPEDMSPRRIREDEIVYRRAGPAQRSSVAPR